MAFTHLSFRQGILEPVGGYSTSYTYTVVTPPVNLAISLQTLKDHLRITGTSEDAYLTLIIQAVTEFAEKQTSRVFITTTFKTFRDCFCGCIQLKKSPLQSVTSVSYFKDNVLMLVDSSVYYNTLEADYSSIYLVDGKSWPSDVDCRVQAIEVIFIAGYGDNDTDVPADLRMALLNHAADMYENRGDCSDCGSCIPKQSKIIYNKYKIFDVVPTNNCRPFSC